MQHEVQINEIIKNPKATIGRKKRFYFSKFYIKLKFFILQISYFDNNKMCGNRMNLYARK